jgi:hypothetical protein
LAQVAGFPLANAFLKLESIMGNIYKG